MLAEGACRGRKVISSSDNEKMKDALSHSNL